MLCISRYRSMVKEGDMEPFTTTEGVWHMSDLYCFKGERRFLQVRG